ncbi:MAG: NADH-quinone oxidoreductase subunit A [Pirellulales bacterium]
METFVIPVFLLALVAAGLATTLALMGRLFAPHLPEPVKEMPYESGMDPIHDTRRRFSVRFHLLAIAFVVFDVELLFLYPWAVAVRPRHVEMLDDPAAAYISPPLGIEGAVDHGFIESRHLVFWGVMVFIGLLVLGYVYDWRKGIFRWH